MINANTLYCPVIYRAISDTGAQRYIRLPLQERVLSIPALHLKVLSACHGFRTISNHIKVATRLLGISDNHPIAEVINSLRELDLLRPCADVIPTIANINNTVITSFGIVTANRPDECCRALFSYQAHLRLQRRMTAIIVLEGSNQVSYLQNRLQQWPRKASEEPLRYAGVSEKLAYIDALRHVGVDENITRFAIIGDAHGDICSIGANRNALLLDTVGEDVLSVDDDTVCRLYNHPSRAPGLRFGCVGNPRDTWFYNDRNELLSVNECKEADLLLEHEKLLGRSAAAIIQEGNLDQLEGDGLCSDLLYSLQTGTGKVLVTLGGVLGDSGAYSSKWILGVNKDTRRRLFADQTLFRTALRSREVLSVVSLQMIAHSRFCAATTIALHNTGILPPFLPIGRNEDGAFGFLLNIANPYAFIGHLPIAVFHAASRDRKYIAMPEFRLADLFLSLLASHEVSGDIASSRHLRLLGSYLIEIGSLPDAELSKVVSEAVIDREAQLIRNLNVGEILTDRIPEYFENEIYQYRRHLLEDITYGDIKIPVELYHAYGENAFQRMKEFISDAGRLLYSWPDVVQASIYLKSKGIRLSRTL